MTNITLNINLEEGEELVESVETQQFPGIGGLGKTITITTIKKKYEPPKKALEEIPSPWYGTL